MAHKRQKPSKDDEVWRKYGVGTPASDTLDVFDEPGRVSLNSKPKSIALLERYGAKPPMDEWFESINEPSAPSLDAWSEGLHRPPAESAFVAVTAEELSSSEERDDPFASSDEMDVRQPARINWHNYSAQELDAASSYMFAESLEEDFEIDAGIAPVFRRTKLVTRFDTVLRRLGLDYHGVDDHASVPRRRLRYYMTTHRNLCVVLLLDGAEKSARLMNYFYLDAA
jgi:hypothetical protein